MEEKSLEEWLKSGIALAGPNARNDSLCRQISVGEARRILQLLTAASNLYAIFPRDEISHTQKECLLEMRDAIGKMRSWL